MFDLSWGEILVIGGVALVVIGPKDLPKALRTVGNMTAKVRRMAAEFQTQFNDAMREAELDELRKEVDGINRSVASTTPAFNPLQTVRDEIKGAIEAPLGTGTAPQAGADPSAAVPALEANSSGASSDSLSVAPATADANAAEAGVAPVAEGASATEVKPPPARPDGA
jgi:sec-independent protein translocase protein TatB